MSTLQSLFSWLSRALRGPRVDFDSFKPSDEVSEPECTVVVPLRDRPDQMVLFDVANAFAQERVRFKKLLMQAEGLNPEAARDDGLCKFGLWLRFADPAPDKRKLLGHIALWHAQWHEGAEEAARLLNDGNREQALRVYQNGRCRIASARISVLLEQFWDTTPDTP